MQKKYFIAAALIALLAVTLVAIQPAQSENSSPAIPDQAAVEQLADSAVAVELKWYTIQEALKLQETTKKKIFMDVYTTWCGPCKMLDANTFSHPVIKKLLADNFIPVKFNAESGDTIVYKGQTFVNPNYTPQPRKSTHQFAIHIASTNQGLAYPTMVFLDENGDMIQPLTGYLEPARMEPILSFFGTDAYKSIAWPDFFNGFKSAITQ